MSRWAERRARRIAELREGVGDERSRPIYVRLNAVPGDKLHLFSPPISPVGKARRAEEERAWKHEQPEFPRPPLPPPTHEGMPRGDWLDLLSLED